ncbi:hypothetical protein GL263_02755 [Streptomyces durbertensis]|uniref:Uncharacterized protein n=1 Tax=Streptomyces durbertensis TaxID=2448886 RepID=A0ABR6EAZ0_9ACTN|nr:hypothetical protein [Streptomyces durbertensis]
MVNDIIADERSPVSASGHAYGEAERREANLIYEYADHLQRHGHRVARQLIQIPGEPRPHRTDLYDTSTNRLIEAKGTLHREAVRLAIGQLFDYRRFLSPEPALGLLLPAKPSADILELCRALGVKIIWQEGGGFTESSGG